MKKPTYTSTLSIIIDLYLKRCESSFSEDGLKNYYQSAFVNKKLSRRANKKVSQ